MLQSIFMRSVLLLIEAVAVAILAVSPANAQLRSERQFVPGEIIVKMVSDTGVEASGESLGISTPGEPPRTTSGGELIFDLKNVVGFAAMTDAELAEQVLTLVEDLRELETIEYAQPNWILQPVASSSGVEPNDPRYVDQWHYKTRGTSSHESPGGINLPKAWVSVTGAHDVVVAVIDTGIVFDHEDIVDSPNLLPGFDMIESSSAANDGDGRDPDPTDAGDGVEFGECGFPHLPRPDSWHGTHVAGTVGAVKSDNGLGVAGVNWSTKVMPIRVLGKCGGSTVDINDAIRWAAGLNVPGGVPQNENKADVINLSLGGAQACTESPSTQRAINDAVAAGVTVVVAAGNDAQDAANFNPASCDNVITVAASDARGHLAQRYSNFGDVIEIMAPGGDVQRDDNGDGVPDGVLSTTKSGYDLYNGTSMAAPHAAGVAALLIAGDGSLRNQPAAVLTKLQDLAVARTPVECPKPCGAGLLSAVPE